MRIKCPICGAGYEEESVKFCKVCMYSIGTDVYLTNLLNRPTTEDLKRYNQSLEEFRGLWNERSGKTFESKNTGPKASIHKGMIKMVELVGGTFTMGEKPEPEDTNPYYIAWPLYEHEVTLSSYYIGKYAVTQEEWERVMESNPSNFKGRKRPVEQVTWYESIEYCNRLSEKEGLQQAYTINKDYKDPNKKDPSDDEWQVTCDFSSNGYRLPTEAEWEYAARGGTKSMGYKYSGSNYIEEVAWYSKNSNDETHEVGEKKPNELGLYDMSGNVLEWCWDRHGVSTTKSETNPRVAKTGFNRVNRGGNWYYAAEYCRVAYRASYDPFDGDCFLGFRLSRTKS